MSLRLSTLPPVTSTVAVVFGSVFDSTFAIAPPMGYHTPPVPPVDIVSLVCACATPTHAQQASKSQNSRFIPPPRNFSEQVHRRRRKEPDQHKDESDRAEAG